MASTEDYLSSVCLWPVAWAPINWAVCNGQLMSISECTALFSLIGTQFGGDGVTTFALPNLQGSAAVGAGVDTFGNDYQLGEIGGSTKATLNGTNTPLPLHTHGIAAAVSIKAFNGAGQINTPGGYYLANSPGGDGFTDQADTSLAAVDASVTIGISQASGQVQSFSTLPPYLAMNYIICTDGYFPPRNN